VLFLGTLLARVIARWCKESEIAKRAFADGSARSAIRGLFEIYATGRGPGHDVTALVTAIDAQLARVVAEPVTEAELQKVKARVELSLLQGLETASGKAEQIGFYDTMLGDPAGALHAAGAYRRTTASDLLARGPSLPRGEAHDRRGTPRGRSSPRAPTVAS